MKTMMKIPLVLDPQKEGGWTITSPLVPELVTEIDELDANLRADHGDAPVWFESLIMAEG